MAKKRKTVAKKKVAKKPMPTKAQLKSAASVLGRAGGRASGKSKSTKTAYKVNGKRYYI